MFGAIVGFLSQYIRALIAYKTKEEVEAGEEYIIIFKRVIFLGIIASLIYYFTINIWMLIAGFVLGLFFKKVYFYFGFMIDARKLWALVHR